MCRIAPAPPSSRRPGTTAAKLGQGARCEAPKPKPLRPPPLLPLVGAGAVAPVPGTRPHDHPRGLAYLELARLNSTPHAELVLARALRTEQVVVVKRLHRRGGDDDAWLRELRVAETLRRGPTHPNLIRVLDVVTTTTGRDGDGGEVLLEHCPGGDLHAHLADRPMPRLPWPAAADALLQLARGLACLHRQHIAHLDVSPENVLLVFHDRQTTYKLCDFGLCTDTRRPCRGPVGKPFYMAPEVAAGERPFAPIPADLWSLGAVFFVLLTGAPVAPRATTACGAFRAFMALGPRGVLRAWGLVDDVPPEALDLLERLLAVDPARRPPNLPAVLAHPLLRWAAAQRCE